MKRVAIFATILAAMTGGTLLAQTATAQERPDQQAFFAI